MVGLSRRRFLGVAGALAGALLAGCGRDEARRRPPSDAEIVRDLLRRELHALESVRRLRDATAIARQDREHVARLSSAIGADFFTIKAAPDPTPVAMLQALDAKQQALFAYVEALPELDDPALRELVMQIAASEAEHLAALRLATGDEPVPDAFAGYLEPTA